MKTLSLLTALVVLTGSALSQDAAPAPPTAPFTPTPPTERLVGIAYSTWHQNKNWGANS